MEPSRPFSKKINGGPQLRPPSNKKDPSSSLPVLDEVNKNPFGLMEISGTKITKASAYRKPNFNTSGTTGLRRSSIKGNEQNNSQSTQYNENQQDEEAKMISSMEKGRYNDDFRQSLESLNSTLRSEESNLYIDDGYDEEDLLRNKQDFNAYMKQRVEQNENIKRLYQNHFLEEKRRQYDEEEELKNQTSKPFNRTTTKSARMSASQKQQSVIATNSNTGSLQYEKSTEYGESATRNHDNDDAESDFTGDPFSRSFTESTTTKGAGQRKIINGTTTGVAASTQAVISGQSSKPFKISELKRNSSRTETNSQTNDQDKKRQHLSIKEKKRIESEEAILKKSKNAANVWKINADPVELRQMRAAAQHVDERRFREMEKMQESVAEMEKKMSKKNKLKFKALVEGSSDMQGLIDNGSMMTEFDLILAEREQRQYEIEREGRLNSLRDLVDESVDDLSEMSAQEIRQRALFITDFGKKKGEKKQKTLKKEVEEEEKKDEDDFEVDLDSSMEKAKKDNGTFFISKNIENAFKSETVQAEEGLVSRLPEPARNRLASLLVGCDEFDQRREEDQLISEGNPYEQTEEETKQIQELQESLKNVQMDEVQIQNLLGHELFSMKNAILPKDPQLKDEAERKILREKMNSVNDRLKELFDGEKRKDEEGQGKVGNKVEKIKIKNLVNSIIDQAGGIKNAASQSIEMENLLQEFQDNARMLSESRQIITNLASQNIEEELGEYRQLLQEATIMQIQFEQMAEIQASQALMEEQSQIIEEFKSRFSEINAIQDEISKRESDFMQVIKDNNLEGVFGIHFNKNIEGEPENNNDYEVEDIAALQEEAMMKLQEEINSQILQINAKYNELNENQMDEKFKEMQEIDRQIEESMAVSNPDLLDRLKQSVIVQQEEEDRQLLQRSMVNRPRTRQKRESNNQAIEEFNHDAQQENLSNDYQPINIPLLNDQIEYKTELSQSYYKNKRMIEENLILIDQIKANKPTIKSISNKNEFEEEGEEEPNIQDSETNQETKDLSSLLQQNGFDQQCDFEDSLEM